MEFNRDPRFLRILEIITGTHDVSIVRLRKYHLRLSFGFHVV